MAWYTIVAALIMLAIIYYGMHLDRYSHIEHEQRRKQAENSDWMGDY